MAWLTTGTCRLGSPARCTETRGSMSLVGIFVLVHGIVLLPFLA